MESCERKLNTSLQLVHLAVLALLTQEIVNWLLEPVDILFLILLAILNHFAAPNRH